MNFTAEYSEVPLAIARRVCCGGHTGLRLDVWEICLRKSKRLSHNTMAIHDNRPLNLFHNCRDNSHNAHILYFVPILIIFLTFSPVVVRNVGEKMGATPLKWHMYFRRQRSGKFLFLSYLSM